MKKGFTLIELLVVIIIIGILAAFVVASFTTAQRKSRDTRRKSDLDAVKKAMELAKNDCTGSTYYPRPGLQGGGGYALLGSSHLEPQGYIKVMPQDPINTSPHFYYYYPSSTSAVSGACPQFAQQNGTPDYRIIALMENENDPQALETRDRCSATGFTGLTPPYNPAAYVLCP